jgi:hypothetical protein
VRLVPAAWNFRKSYAKVSDLLDKVYGDINPLMRHASADRGQRELHHDVGAHRRASRCNATIAAANQRLQQAMALTEQRLGEFNALLEVVQEEAETMFIATASTVRGVRTGAAALHTEDAEADTSALRIRRRRRTTMGTAIPTSPKRGPRVRESARDGEIGRDAQYDLLTAALIGAAIGADGNPASAPRTFGQPTSHADAPRGQMGRTRRDGGKRRRRALGARARG